MYTIEVIGTTSNTPEGTRGTEIKKWLETYSYKYNVESFVILDDESFDLQGFVGKELVKTSEVKGAWYENTGLKRKHMKKVICILNNC